MEPYSGQSGPDQQPATQPPATPAPIDPYLQQASATLPPEPVVAMTEPEPQPELENIQTSPAPGSYQASTAPVLQWQASEYINREKNTTWFVGLVVVAVALAVVAIFLMKDFTFALLIVVMAVALAVIARRPSREIQYQLSEAQLRVGEKTFPLGNFRAFGVVQEGAIYSVSLTPVKRFRPSVNVYFPQELGEQIVDILGSVLPMEDMKPDMIDKITEKLNF